jgi:anti-sigma B factor antagonist
VKLSRRKRRPEASPPEALPPLDVEVAPAPYGAILSIAGELDIATVPRVRGALASPAVAGADTVVVDLTEVTFMDSTGLAAVLELERELTARGGRLVIACPEGPARLLLDVTGVAARLELHPTRAGAQAAISAPPGSP